ncbi:SIMPL domain-containing protein [Sorangium sp. So ce1024]|uniref:SIMPL domain-containing protein n=1 Tax=Sorangium sp. So ce1024 TaxID=3133327 RepID=UPI003F0F542C
MRNQSSLSRRLCLAASLLSTAPLLAACAPQAAPQAVSPDVNTITVIGRGEVSSRPDVARVQLGIEVMAPTVAEATRTAAARMNEILAALRKTGIADKDIQTSNYSIQLVKQPEVPPWAPTAHGPSMGASVAAAAPEAAAQAASPPAPAAPAARGPKAAPAPAAKPAAPPADLAPARPTPAPPAHFYQVSNTVTVVIRNLDQVGAVLDTVVAAGANNVWGVSFGLDKTDALEAQAREKAIADARSRAEALARLQGVSLGRVVAISEIVESGPVHGRMAMASVAYGDAGTPVTPGEVQLGTQVKVVYALDRAPASPPK